MVSSIERYHLRNKWEVHEKEMCGLHANTFAHRCLFYAFLGFVNLFFYFYWAFC